MLWNDTEERVMNLNNPRDVAVIKEFLTPFGLTFDETVDYTLALYRNDLMVATGSLRGEVFRNIAIDEALQGEGLTAAVISHLMQEAGRRGFYHYFLFTKPDKAHLFQALGFSEVARAEPFAVLLETGMGSIVSYCQEIAQQAARLPVGSRAGLVVNCNPFTKGHRAVIASAAAENAAVVVLVVSEDRSLFPFVDRFQLVQEGLADLQNVLVLPGGKYVISAATFPGYFTRGDATVQAQTRLDATIFGRYIAPALGLTCRYVGEEPYCAVTKAYNETLMKVLPQYGVQVRLLPRVTEGGQIISASHVREAIRTENWETVRCMVPDSTYRYLTSTAASAVLSKIRGSHTRH